MNLHYISKSLSDPQPILTKPQQPLPELWLSVIETDQQKRHDNFLAHAKHIMADMPDTYAYIAEILLDAYVVSTENKFRLIVDFETNDEVYSYQSLQPVEQSLFGGRVAEFYRHLNGFCDMNFFGGMLPISHITPITEAEFYTEPSASLYKKPEYADFVEIFSSGGKGIGYLSKGAHSMMIL